MAFKLQTLRRWGRLASRAFVVASLVLALGFGAWVGVREFAANRLETAALWAAGGLDAEPSVTAALRLCGPVCPARAYEAASEAYVQLARRSSGHERAVLLAHARNMAEQGLARSPLSAEGWARLALIHAQEAGGRATPAAIEALKRSYAAAPYSRGSAKWRIAFCAAHWGEVTPALRAAALAEMTWLGKLNGGEAYDFITQIDDPFIRQLFEIRVLPPPPQD